MDFLLHIDKYLANLINRYDGYTYLILFGMIFIKTGVMIAHFIVRDSVLFATGALVAGLDTCLDISCSRYIVRGFHRLDIPYTGINRAIPEVKKSIQLIKFSLITQTGLKRLIISK